MKAIPPTKVWTKYSTFWTVYFSAQSLERFVQNELTCICYKSFLEAVLGKQPLKSGRWILDGTDGLPGVNTRLNVRAVFS